MAVVQYIAHLYLASKGQTLPLSSGYPFDPFLRTADYSVSAVGQAHLRNDLFYARHTLLVGKITVHAQQCLKAENFADSECSDKEVVLLDVAGNAGQHISVHVFTIQQYVASNHQFVRITKG